MSLNSRPLDGRAPIATVVNCAQVAIMQSFLLPPFVLRNINSASRTLPLPCHMTEHRTRIRRVRRNSCLELPEPFLRLVRPLRQLVCPSLDQDAGMLFLFNALLSIVSSGISVFRTDIPHMAPPHLPVLFLFLTFIVSRARIVDVCGTLLLLNDPLCWSPFK